MSKMMIIIQFIRKTYRRINSPDVSISRVNISDISTITLGTQFLLEERKERLAVLFVSLGIDVTETILSVRVGFFSHDS